MNKTQRIHAIKRVLRADFPGTVLELTRNYDGIDFYRIRNSHRAELADRIEMALRDEKCGKTQHIN